MSISRKEACNINPLIDTASGETLSRVRDMLFLLQDLNAQDVVDCGESNRAVFHILYLIQYAIDFEMGSGEGKS
jgi:Holliday junction resolvasome RuvABC ATP-dependent DNA helicase subunit